MPFSNVRAALLAAGLTLMLPACNASAGMPSNAPAANPDASGSRAAVASPADTTSILKLLTKDVTIGSTVDPANGDVGPRAVTVVQYNYGKLKDGSLLVCNFDDSSGTPGKGTTIEELSPKAGSKPATFIQNSKIEGCDGSAITGGDQTYGTGFTSKVMSWIDQAGVLKKSYGKPISEPLGDGNVPQLYLYSPEFVFIGNADTGTLDSYSFGGNGTGLVTEVVNGFAVNKGSGWSALGPSGIAYWCGVLPGYLHCKNNADTLFVADGACNAVVEISHAGSLLETDEITVEPGCKTFKCKYPKTTCATVVKAGSPLDKPVAMAILPNGNLIVANTANNTLVEMTQKGQVLDTKVVDNSKTPGIFGVAANGKDDSNTVLFYTDTNTNTLHELER
jgi:Na+-translocating ferredoxin:NAD+ oxidoreductase RnfG subunit